MGRHYSAPRAKGKLGERELADVRGGVTLRRRALLQRHREQAHENRPDGDLQLLGFLVLELNQRVEGALGFAGRSTLDREGENPFRPVDR